MFSHCIFWPNFFRGIEVIQLPLPNPGQANSIFMVTEIPQMFSSINVTLLKVTDYASY